MGDPEVLMDYNHPLNLPEVLQAIKTLKRNKAVGLDGIMNEMFMYGGPVLGRAVHKLFSEIWESEEVPTQWSKGLIFPLGKGGGEGKV